MTTAAEVIAGALHLFGIVDITEDPAAADYAKGVPILNDLLRAEQADGACQYLIQRTSVQLPPGVNGSVYSFSVGAAATNAVQVDAVAVRSIWVKDIGSTVNRETRTAPMADVVRTTYPGIITKWHPERQADGSVLITAWSPPRAAVSVLIEYGGRVPIISAADGSDVVTLPPEGIMDAKLLFGRRIMGSYGRALSPTDPIIVDAEAANKRWRDWARGQQWLRFVRS